MPFLSCFTVHLNYRDLVLKHVLILEVGIRWWAYGFMQGAPGRNIKQVIDCMGTLSELRVCFWLCLVRQVAFDPLIRRTKAS